MPLLPLKVPCARRCVGLAAALAVIGCSVGNQLVAGRTEYELYRNTRLAPTLEERLAAGNRYLRNDPEGRYAPEIKAWFEPAEKAYVGGAWNSLPRLRAYTSALPDGPSIERVKARTEELEATIGFAAKREQESQARVEALQASLERAADQRRAFLDEVSGWIGAFAGIKAWGKPLAELGSDVTGKFGSENPMDSCVEELCSVERTPRFAIPVKDKLVPREAAYSVELVLENGGVVQARLRGRELFSRVGEAIDMRAVSFADPQSRAEGIGRALGLVTNSLGASFGGDGCERPAIAPVVLERACAGTRVVATAALTTGEDDVLVFGPEAPPAQPAKPRGKSMKAPKGATKGAPPKP
ncbi:MAG TPA: hypothetical protein VFZ53_02860 [Polyangiaceae bacterium]